MSLKGKAITVVVAAAAAIAALWWLKNKFTKDSFLFGTSNEASLGASIYNFFHPDTASSLDEDQAVKTCNALWRSGGKMTGPICQKLLQEGKLTPP